ncbi:pancreatic lipase-related protein 2-like [Ptychodera flava]|uniref:pancreatic lipase-related protein 2-like n=1 Tax=Ptychodera flava TaxID=63121 RepID=UPI00396A81B3
MNSLVSILCLAWLQTCLAADFPVEFRLYTRQNWNTYQVVSRTSRSSLTGSNFNKFKDTKFITHGYTESASTSSWMTKMKDELLTYANYNVFLVDWEKGADEVRYDLSADNADECGEEIYQFVAFLKSTLSYSESRVHLIGFSLGAQASGSAGKRLPTIARISGLDPAGPGFDTYGNDKKLDSSDAQFVDIIHVDGNTVGGAGCWYPSGHVDFYPNGGQGQPACQSSKRDVSAYGNLGCDHMMAPEYYIESINVNCDFKAYPCEHGEACYSCRGRCNRMGFHAKTSPTGVFYLETNSRSNYCQN